MQAAPKIAILDKLVNILEMWLRRLASVRDNLRAARRWALDAHDTAEAEALADDDKILKSGELLSLVCQSLLIEPISVFVDHDNLTTISDSTFSPLAISTLVVVIFIVNVLLRHVRLLCYCVAVVLYYVDARSPSPPSPLPVEEGWRGSDE